MQCFTSMQCFAYSSVSSKNCASHDCSASHHCRLVSSLFETRHAKTSLVQTCHKNEIRLHIPPFKLAASGDVQDKTQNSSTCHTNFLGKIMQHAGQKKTFVWFWLFHATCNKNTNMLRGPFFQHVLRPK